MWEVFLTSIVEAEDVKTATNIFCGLCATDRPWKTLNRVVTYQGPDPPRGLTNRAAIDPVALREDPANPGLWSYLDTATRKQSYLINLRYEITKEHLGPDAPAMDLAATKGILRFADMPDPPPPRKPLLLQRRVAELWEQKNLPAVLEANGYVYKNEGLTEVYQFYRGEVEFCMARDLNTRPREAYVPLEDMPASFKMLDKLPPWGEIYPDDEDGRWSLVVRMYVPEGNPEALANAQDTLMAVQKELGGVIEFYEIDRIFHDTRTWVGDRLARRH